MEKEKSKRKVVEAVPEDRLSKSATQFKCITNKMVETYTKKNHDYGNSFDQSLNRFGLVAAQVRMGDKLNRVDSLIEKIALVEDESIRDTLLDLTNYATMTVMWLDNNVVNRN